jgi:glyoxylase-like metal-dependent hydrolase (beta-lactamase superfamily II)
LKVTPIHAGNPGPMTGDGNWTYLFPAQSPVLFDAGVGLSSHLDAIAAAVPEGPAHVVVSHAHPDHASGAPVLAQRWPHARFGKVPWADRDPAGLEWEPLADRQKLIIEDGELEVLHTPGHAPDHVVLWHAESRTLFGADLMQLGNTVVIPASAGGDLAAYLKSLRLVRSLAPARVYPAHGPVIEDPVTLIDRYLAHRQHRENQVLNALESNRTTIGAIVETIYAGLLPALVPMAEESVLAHLVKLEHDGLVRQEGDRWKLVT